MEKGAAMKYDVFIDDVVLHGTIAVEADTKDKAVAKATKGV